MRNFIAASDQGLTYEESAFSFVCKEIESKAKKTTAPRMITMFSLEIVVIDKP
jgi:hypothetical protein